MPTGRPTLPKAREDRLVIRELSDEVLVYDLERHKAHCLSRLAADIWRRCDGRTSVAEIAEDLRRERGATIEDEVVWVALKRLGKARLLEQTLAEGPPSRPRRELLRRVAAVGGLSVLSITVPTAALAASCIAAGSNAPADCVDKTCTSADGRQCCSCQTKCACGGAGKNCGSGKGFTNVCS